MSEDRDLWALWPDDFMCPLGESECYLNPPCALSDDFAVVEVTEYDEHGEPIKWVRGPRCAATPTSNPSPYWRN